MTASYEYYAGRFGGEIIPAESYERFSKKAENYLDAVTFDRLGGYKPNRKERGKILDCLCELAEAMYKIERDGGVLRVREVEAFLYDEMCRKMADFKTLTGGNPAKANPKLTALNVELVQVETEIEKLLDTLIGANATLLNYANHKIEELDAKRQSPIKAIADMSAEAVSPEHIQRISGYLNDWDGISFEDRRLVADGLISTVRATDQSVQIEWKI
jgi:hypothetical protein